MRFTKTAGKGLRAIVAQVSRDNVEAAQELAYRIKDACKGLRTHPEIGPVVREFGIEFLRERVVPPYRIVYQVGEKQVLILAIVHGRRSLTLDLVDEDG